MPKMRLGLSFILTVLLAGSCASALAQNCGVSGTEAWNTTLHNIVAQCAGVFLSPDEHLTLRISPEGEMSLQAGSENLQWNVPKLVPPAMIAWSPKSNAFFINDGDGSGMSSSFRLFKVRGGQVSEDNSVERAAVSLFRRKTHCSPSTADPNVWGFGWNTDGGEIFLLVQPTVNEPCGRPEAFIGLIVRQSDGVVIETLTKARLKDRFAAQLPSAMFQR